MLLKGYGNILLSFELHKACQLFMNNLTLLSPLRYVFCWQWWIILQSLSLAYCNYFVRNFRKALFVSIQMALFAEAVASLIYNSKQLVHILLMIIALQLNFWWMYTGCYVETNCTQPTVVNFLQWLFPFLDARVIFPPIKISTFNQVQLRNSLWEFARSIEITPWESWNPELATSYKPNMKWQAKRA